jgi:hypothetical protein
MSVTRIFPSGGWKKIERVWPVMAAKSVMIRQSMTGLVEIRLMIAREKMSDVHSV